jgi:membrane associated rhomboid family serine protease
MPLTDGTRPRRFPSVATRLIAASLIAWIFYELRHLDAAAAHSSLYPCDVSGASHAPLPWGVSWFTAMFMHASWSHLLGNMWLIGAIIGVPIAAALPIVVEELTAPRRASIAAADQQSPATNGVVSAR